MLPAFASLEQMTARIPDGIKSADEARAQAALEDASTLIRSEVAPITWVTDDELAADLPDIVVVVTLRSAIRAFENPEGVTQEAVASYSYSVGNSSTDVYLTSAERRQVQKAAGIGGLWTQSTTRGDVPDVDPVTRCEAGSEYLPVEPAGEPIPWSGPDGY